tara:strand:- start:3052 stop:3639 length:588 start_codon:yes stop_codon:yes gene_type:complete
MKRYIQLILILILIIISFFFYKSYFLDDKKINLNNKKTNNEIPNADEKNSSNNLIKNLKYEVKLDQDKQYIITADLSELTYEDDVELVNMQEVKAIFISEDNIPLTITSETAIYNSLNYNTNFRKNVQVEYLSNIIVADKMDINFQENIITIYENVKYDGLEMNMKTDNIKINLITKKIDIYMNNNSNNVEIETK